MGSVQDASTAASAPICGISSGVAAATRRLRTKKRTAATSRTAATTTGMMMSIEAPREFDEEPLAGQVGTLQFAQLVEGSSRDPV